MCFSEKINHNSLLKAWHGCCALWIEVKMSSLKQNVGAMILFRQPDKDPERLAYLIDVK